MKTILITGILFFSVALYSCGGGNNNNNSESNDSGVVSNATNEPATLGNGSAVDVDKPSDSKGVGQFKDVEISANIDPQLAEKGKEIFQTKCTACHQATEQKLIGPGLKGITKIRTPEWIMNMITNPTEMTQKDPVAHELYEEFNHTQMTDQGVDKEGARAILEFFRQNDAQ